MKKVTLVALVWVLVVGAFPQSPPKFPPKPSKGFISDGANLISQLDRALVNRISERSRNEDQAPVVVVTITSLGSMRATGQSIDQYAQLLFNKWQIGNGYSNRGLLLLVSKEDRKARIQTGAGWNQQLDGATSLIMKNRIVPRFKAGDYTGGITDGVQDLCDLARREKYSTSSSQVAPSYGGSGPFPYDQSMGLPTGDISFPNPLPFLLCPGIVVLMVILGAFNTLSRGGVRRRYYGGNGYRNGGIWNSSSTNVFIDNSSSSSSFTDSSSSGGFSSGSDFSGGGSSDGGGSSGSW